MSQIGLVKKKKKKVRQIGEKWIRELKNRTVINKNVSIQIYLIKKKTLLPLRVLCLQQREYTEIPKTKPF